MQSSGEYMLSEHFSRAEFACRCGCGFDSIAISLVRCLEDLRRVVGHPITILSGCRCVRHNKAVGGEPDSLHLGGYAADICAPGVPAWRLYLLARDLPFGGFGLSDEQCFLHLDIRSKPAKWCYKNGKQCAWNFHGGLDIPQAVA
jgi:uncharacterized protein YcbK (DUF882 family)